MFRCILIVHVYSRVNFICVNNYVAEWNLSSSKPELQRLSVLPTFYTCSCDSTAEVASLLSSSQGIQSGDEMREKRTQWSSHCGKTVFIPQWFAKQLRFVILHKILTRENWKFSYSFTHNRSGVWSEFSNWFSLRLPDSASLWGMQAPQSCDLL